MPDDDDATREFLGTVRAVAANGDSKELETFLDNHSRVWAAVALLRGLNPYWQREFCRTLKREHPDWFNPEPTT